MAYLTQRNRSLAGTLQNRSGLALFAFLTAVCIALLLAGGLAAFAGWRIRQWEPYREAFDRARTNPWVLEQIGEPIEPGWFMPCGMTTDCRRHASGMKFAIEGSRGRAIVDFAVICRNEQWEFKKLDVFPDQTGGRIDVLHEYHNPE